MDWLKDAFKRPLKINYTQGMRKGMPWLGVILHVAVSESDSLYGWFSQARAGASSHFYVRRDGTYEQYVSLRDRSWAQVAGNDQYISIETQGMGSGKWTAAQVATLAMLCRTLSDEYGFPLTAMTTSEKGVKGIGYHLLGVPADASQKSRGVSQTGGLMWSSAVGKVCPGPDRVKQVPEIIKQAKRKPNGGSKPVSKWSGKMASPVAGRVSCEWRGYRNHSGIDIACPVGTPVYAAYAGTVEKAGWAIVAGRSGYGIVIRNGDREAQYYGHLSKIQVRKGQRIKQGQQIALSGATGNVTGPHLHFETWKKGARGQYGGDTNPRVHFRFHRVKVGGKVGQKGFAKATRKAAKKSKVKSVKAPKKRRKNGLYAGKIDGSRGPMTIKALQRMLANRGFYNRVIDGQWAYYTSRGLQLWLRSQGFYNRMVDGKAGRYTNNGLQRRLRKGGWYKKKISGKWYQVAVDGSWGPETTKALQRLLAYTRK